MQKLKLNEYGWREARIIFKGFDIEVQELDIVKGVRVSTNVHSFLGGRDIVAEF